MQHGKWRCAKPKVWGNFPLKWDRQCTQKLQETTRVTTSTHWIKKDSDSHFTVVIVAVN